MRLLVVPLLLAAGSVLACTPETPTRPDVPPRAGLGLPSDPPIAASRALLPAMPADCGTAPELAAVRTRPGTSTLPLPTAIQHARQTVGHPAGNVGRWFDTEPTDATFVKLRNGRSVWMLGFAEPPPFRVGGVWSPTRTQWTAWIALLDGRTGSFVLAVSCGGVTTQR